MDVTDALVVAVPEWNVRVPRDEFAMMWREAERWYGLWMPNPVHAGTVTGIVEVCRWLATVTDTAPITRQSVRAHPTAIDAEVDAIQEAIDSTHRPAWWYTPPGWGNGAIACFTWAWLGGDLPLYCFHFADDTAGPSPV